MWFHIVTCILLIAQILGFISISWWLVFLPSIIGVVIGLLVVAAALFVVSK